MVRGETEEAFPPPSCQTVGGKSKTWIVQSEKLTLTAACDRTLGSVDTLRENVVAETWGRSEFVSVTSLFYILWRLFKSQFSDSDFQRTGVFYFRAHSSSRLLLNYCFAPGMGQSACGTKRIWHVSGSHGPIAEVGDTQKQAASLGSISNFENPLT